MNPVKRPNLDKFLEEIKYTIRFKPASFRPGEWPALQKYGAGFSFDKFDRLSNTFDFKGVDVMATVRNPLIGEPLVKVYQQTVGIDVIMLADFSTSMSFGFKEPKIWQVAKLATLFGFTAYKYGDRFGCIAFDHHLVRDFYYAPDRSDIWGLNIGKQILEYEPSSGSANGILDIGPFLPRQKSLLVLVSDFYWQPSLLKEALNLLVEHDVMPIMLRQGFERQWPKSMFGLLAFKDAEQEREKTVLVCGRTRRKFNKRARENEKQIQAICSDARFNLVILEDIIPEAFFTPEEEERL